MFVDEARIEVKGGKAGNGIVALRREKYVPLGGPSGDDGDKGGDIVLRADRHQRTLLDLSRKRHHRGGRGRHGEGSRRKGRDGAGITILVPIGTQIFVKDTGELLTPGQEYIVARGGLGGRGNTHFTTSTRQAPGFCEKGAKGEERLLLLSLKLLADVDLIGLPNAGKSIKADFTMNDVNPTWLALPGNRDLTPDEIAAKLIAPANSSIALQGYPLPDATISKDTFEDTFAVSVPSASKVFTPQSLLTRVSCHLSQQYKAYVLLGAGYTIKFIMQTAPDGSTEMSILRSAGAGP